MIESELLPRRLPNSDEVEACVPTAVVWEVTLACNLHCKLCGSRAGKARREELSTQEAYDLIDQLAAIGVRDVGLIGGESIFARTGSKLSPRSCAQA
jgi:MoaA/NifB/PqqE/SkfB family radical SAM enzyme